MNWGKIGIDVGSHLILVLMSVGICVLGFRKYIGPEFVQALEESQKVSSTLAGLGNLKKSEWQDGNKIAKAVGADLIKAKIPELGALKLIVGADTWEMIEELIEENPDQAMLLYEKYGHLFPGGAAAASEATDF